MFPVNERIIGETIRQIRKARGLSLTAAAKAAGVTKSALSKIETAQVSAPISTLIGIARALDVHLSRFFAEPEKAPKHVIMRKGKAPVISRGGSEYGYAYQALAMEMPEKMADPFLLTIRPGDKPGSFRHGGEEFLYMLSGRMEMTLGRQRFELSAGDSIYFDPNQTHTCTALDGKPVRMLCVFIQPSSPRKS